MTNALKRFINSLRKEQCQTTVDENDSTKEQTLERLIRQQREARAALINKLEINTTQGNELVFHPSELKDYLQDSRAADYRLSGYYGKDHPLVTNGRFIKLDIGNEVHRAIYEYAKASNNLRSRDPIINKCVVIPKDTIKKMKGCNLREMADHVKFVEAIAVWCRNSNATNKIVKYLHFIRNPSGSEMGYYRIYIDVMLIVEDSTDADVVLETAYINRNDTDEFRSLVQGGRHIAASIECGGRFDVSRIIDGDSYRLFKKREIYIINSHEAIWGPVATTTI